MTLPLLCLVGFAVWSIALVGAIAVWRVVLVLSGKVPANGFSSGMPHGSERYWRLNRAQMNCIENLPIFGTIIIVGTVVGVDTPLFDRLSLVVISGRVIQSLVHIAHGGKRAVSIRFSAFATQLAALAWMSYEIVRTVGLR